MNRTWILTLAAALLLAVTAAPAHAGWSFLVNLDGFQETPPVVSEHSGFCVAVLSDDETELAINCNHDVDNPIAAHIHVGPPGVAGPPDLPFDDPTSPLTETFLLTPEQAADALAGVDRIADVVAGAQVELAGGADRRPGLGLVGRDALEDLGIEEDAPAGLRRRSSGQEGVDLLPRQVWTPAELWHWLIEACSEYRYRVAAPT